MGTPTTWTDLLGESAMLIRLGQLVFVWPKDAPTIKVVRASQVELDDDLTTDNTKLEVALEIEVPPGLTQDPADTESFPAFCREFVGGGDGFQLTEADLKLLTGDLSDYDDNAGRAMKGILALDSRMREALESRVP